MIHRLSVTDAQTFVDVINEARITPTRPQIMAKIYIRPFVDQTLDTATLSSRTQKKCVKLLYKTCSHHALLPRALEVLVDYDRTGDALYHGGFGDVWRGEFCGRDVAVKVVRIYSHSELQRVINVSC